MNILITKMIIVINSYLANTESIPSVTYISRWHNQDTHLNLPFF